MIRTLDVATIDAVLRRPVLVDRMVQLKRCFVKRRSCCGGDRGEQVDYATAKMVLLTTSQENFDKVCSEFACEGFKFILGDGSQRDRLRSA